MARGWESKSVESQVEDRHRELTDKRPKLTSDQSEIRRKRQGLEMSRRRIQGELEKSKSDMHRHTLQEALAHLDAEIKILDE